MFNKLLSNLPFNPSLINQVSFYSKRLKQETSVRRLGFILMLAIMALQFFTILSPAQPSLAADVNNDLLAHGVTSRDQLINYCNTNTAGYREILAHFAIGCNNLQNNSQVITLSSGATKNGQPLYSMGRIAQGTTNSTTHKPTNESPVQVGGTTFYMRLLTSWDRGGPSNYKALSVGNAFGVQFFILFSCGNVVQFGPPPKPTPPPPPPAPKPKPTPQPKPKPCLASRNTTDVAACIVRSKQASNSTQQIINANNTTANAGDKIVYKLISKNTGNIAITNYVVQDDISDILEYADLENKGASTFEKGVLTWPATSIAAHSTIAKQFTVRVKSPIPKTPGPCNPAVVNPCPVTGSFDLVMTNVYSNEIKIKVKPPVAKRVEITTTKTLINTGPGANLIIGFSITAIVGYFFARSRMMATELDLVRSDYTSGGF